MTLFGKLVKQASVLLGSNLFAAGANFASIVLLAKHLDSKLFGTVVLLQAYILVFAALTNPQAWQGLIRFLSVNENELKSLIQYTFKYDWLCAFIGTGTAVILSSHYLSWMNLDVKYLSTLQLMCVYILLYQTSCSIGLLRFFERFKHLALQNIVSAIALLLLVSLGVSWELSVSYFALAMALSLALGVTVVNVIAFRLYIERVRKSAEKANFKKSELTRFNMYAHLTAIVDIPVKQLDTVLVGAALSVEASGVYKVIKQIGTLTTKFTGPITQVLYPELNRALARNNRLLVRKLITKITLSLLAVALPAALLLAVTSPYWLPVVFSQEFAKYAVELSVYLVVHAVAISFLAVHPTFLAFGYVRSLLLITLLANIALCGFIFVLAPYYGLIGVVFAIAIQYGVTILAKLLPISTQLRNEY